MQLQQRRHAIIDASFSMHPSPSPIRSQHSQFSNHPTLCCGTVPCYNDIATCLNTSIHRLSHAYKICIRPATNFCSKLVNIKNKHIVVHRNGLHKTRENI
jgi:hypothetical protein